jgi:hypothetical protein
MRPPEADIQVLAYLRLKESLRSIGALHAAAVVLQLTEGAALARSRESLHFSPRTDEEIEELMIEQHETLMNTKVSNVWKPYPPSAGALVLGGMPCSDPTRAQPCTDDNLC